MPERPGLRSLLRALGRRSPRARGAVRLAGLASQVVVSRDRWGIPHVHAATDADAWFALGFCHGQDRGFQLELIARAGRGTLAELLGPAAVALDRLSRTLGFARLASEQVGMVDRDVIEVLEAYVAGINAAGAVEPRPHELALLRARRSRWAVADVLAFQGLQCLALSGNWDAELARLHVLLEDGPEALAAVSPEYAARLPATTPVGAAAGPPLARLAADVALLQDVVGGPGASNAWAIAGARTATGTPILANDPHLAPAVPAPWYLTHLRTPDWAVAGASFVGGPAFPSGHNGHAAWGITAGCTDSSDLAWEQIDAATGTARGPTGPEPVERRTEEIGVRGQPALVEEVLVTSRGPVVTPLLHGVSVALALRATWLTPKPVRGFLDVHRAADFATFRDGFRAWPGPALNVVYADRNGHIGWQLVGDLPRRASGQGILPHLAWEAGWAADGVPFDEMPFVLDPEPGFVVSANNAPRADSASAPFLGVDWLDGYRAARLVAAVSERADWDVTSTAALQLDLVSLPWAELRPLVVAVEPGDRTGAAHALLVEWDGVVAPDSPAAAVYELLMAALIRDLAAERAPKSWRWAVGDGFGESLPRTVLGARWTSHAIGLLREAADPSLLIAAALDHAVAMLDERLGPEPTGWGWGRARPLRLMHPLGVRAPLDRMLNLGPVPMGGDTNTVAQAGARPIDPLANPAAIPNQRTVIDLADPERSRFVLAGGQSGNPLSPHYADLFELWQRGDGVPIPWAHEAVVAATVDEMLLRPAVGDG